MNISEQSIIHLDYTYLFLISKLSDIIIQTLYTCTQIVVAIEVTSISTYWSDTCLTLHTLLVVKIFHTRYGIGQIL